MINLTKHIEDAINEVNEGKKLIENNDILNLSRSTKPHPMSTINTQSLINKLCRLPDTRYLEVGVLRGASYFAAAYNNKGVYYGVDNWSKYANNQELIESNIEKYETEDRSFVFFNENSWSLDLEKFNNKINVFFYDGDHSYESQEKILRHFDPILDDEIILLVDDFSAGEVGKIVKSATEAAIKNSSFELVSHRELHEGRKWHNGIYIAHLRRKSN